MAKQTFTTGQVLTADNMTSLQQTAMGGGSATAKTASYTLVAADAGTTIIMNSASATTITVNTGLFAAGDSVFIVNQGAGICTVTAGTATVNTAASLALSQYETGQLYFLSASAAIFSEYQQAASSGSMTSIASGSLSGSALTLSSISASYKDLRLILRDYNPSAGGDLLPRVNAGTDYTVLRTYTTDTSGSSISSATNLAADYLFVMGDSFTSGDNNNVLMLDIYDYADTTSNKLFRAMNKYKKPTPVQFVASQGTINTSSAINAITITLSSGTFSGGTYILYGVN